MDTQNIWKRISSLTLPLSHQLTRLSNIRRKEISLLIPALLFFFNWFILQLLLFPIFIRSGWGLATSRALSTVAANVVTLLFIFTWCWLLRPQRLALVGFRMQSIYYSLKVGLQIGVFFAIFLVLGLKVSTEFCLTVSEPTTIEAWLFTNSSFRGLALRLTLAVVLAPLLEELLFRGLLYTALQRLRGPLFATFSTATLFAFVHLHPINSPNFWFIFFLGLVWARCRETCRSIIPALVSHSLMNLTVVLGSWCEGYCLQRIPWMALSWLCALGTLFYLLLAFVDEKTETTVALVSRTGGAILLLTLSTFLFLAQSGSPFIQHLPSFTLLKSLQLTTRGEYESAESLLEDYLAYNPFNSRIGYRLASIKYDQGKYAEALKLAQSLTQFDSRLSQALRANIEALCLAEMGKDLDKSLELAELSLRLTEVDTPFYLAALDTLGWVHYHRKEYGKAESYVRQAKSCVGWLRTPQVWELEYHLAMISFARGRREEGRLLLMAVLSARQGHEPSKRRAMNAQAKMGFSIATPSPRS